VPPGVPSWPPVGPLLLVAWSGWKPTLAEIGWPNRRNRPWGQRCLCCVGVSRGHWLPWRVHRLQWAGVAVRQRNFLKGGPRDHAAAYLEGVAQCDAAS